MGVYTECWMAVNNTVAQTAEDIGIGSGLRQLTVPTMTMSFINHDQTEVSKAAKLLFQVLAYNVTLSQIASAGYAKQSRRIRQKAMGQQVLLSSVDSSRESKGMSSSRSRQDAWETGSLDSHRSHGSLRSAMSLDQSQCESQSSVSEASASFFGSDHERYLPRLVLDLNLLLHGLGVSQAHESPMQEAIWAALALPTLDQKIAAFVRFAVLVACGLPSGLVLPLSDRKDGEDIDMVVPPFKVFPAGEVNTQIHAKFSSERTLFSRVLLHIPGDMLSRSPLLRQCLVAFGKGLVPPVFSRAALGQIYLSLGEKYSLPQPDAATLVMKMAQHLAVIVTTCSPPPPRLCIGVNMSYPSGVSDLMTATPSALRYLTNRYNTNEPKEVFNTFIKICTAQFQAIMRLYPDRGIELHQFISYSVSTSRLFIQRSRSEAAVLNKLLPLIEKHEACLDSTDGAICNYVDDLRESVSVLMPASIQDPEELGRLLFRGSNVALLFTATEPFWQHAGTEPQFQSMRGVLLLVPEHEFQSMRGVLESFCGIEDMTKVSLSSSLVTVSQANTYYFMFKGIPQPKPFLWLMTGALPPRDSALLSCVRLCHSLVHFPGCIPYLDRDSVQVVQCVLLWYVGLLEGLKASNTKVENARVLAAAYKRTNITVVPIDVPGHVFYPLVVKALDGGYPIIIAGGVVSSPEGIHFKNLLTDYFREQTTRAGQVLTFQDGRYACRLKQPIHKMQLYYIHKMAIAICDNPDNYVRSCTLFDCLPVRPTLTVQLLKVFEDAATGSDTGPLRQAAEAEEACAVLRDRYWTDIRALTARMISTTPSATASTALIRGTGHMLRLAKDVVASYKTLANMWSKPGIDYGLTAGINTIAGTALRFPNPVMRGAGTAEKQLSLLSDVIKEHVETSGYSSLNQETVRRLYYKTCDRLITSAANPRALFDIGQGHLLTILLNWIQQVSSKAIDPRAVAVVALAMSNQFERMASLADPKVVERIYNIALEHRPSQMAMFPGLAAAFKRASVLEANCPAYEGLVEGMVSTDAAFADAILVCTDLDAGTSLLSSLLGNNPNRDAILAGRKVKKKLRLPDCCGSVITDRTIQLHIGALATLNHPGALISIGSWIRALSSATGLEGAHKAFAAHDEEVARTALALKIPQEQIDIRELVSNVLASTRKSVFAIVMAPLNTDVELHLIRSIKEAGHQPVFGLYHGMSPDRIAILHWHQVKHLEVTDPLLQQPMKIVLMVQRRVRGDSKGNQTFMNFYLKKCQYMLAMPEEVHPVTKAFEKIPPVTLEALSPTPHFMSSSSPAIPSFVSPAFSLRMRRILSGMVLSFGQRQYHLACTHSSALEAQVGVDLCIRQITTLSKFLVHYGQDATHIYDAPLLTRDTQTGIARPSLAEPPMPMSRVQSSMSGL
ncbi:hypothetical protein KIPB_000121, partial [Kipferlia bialata]|eukprot:g121.t1